MVEVLNKASQITDVPSQDPRVKRVIKAMDTYQRKPDSLIQILHIIQDLFGYLPLSLIAFVSRELRVPPSQIFGVVTFYHFFSLKPKGEHTCLVCTGTACYVKGAQKIIDEVGKEFHIKPGETTPDNKLGLQTARCIGSCGLAPAVVLDSDILAKVMAAEINALLHARLGDKP